MDSAIRLSTMIAIGPEHFHSMLAGFHAVDEHFRMAPLAQNLPVLMGLLPVWHGNFFGVETVAVLPHDQYLRRFPVYLQQLTMESNGKHEGRPVDYRTRAIYLGRARDGQYSFYGYSVIHHGTKLVPCDLIASRSR
jgi:glucose-6-phosphate isomerase